MAIHMADRVTYSRTLLWTLVMFAWNSDSFLPDPKSELIIISVSDSHQRSRKSMKTCVMVANTAKQGLDPRLELVDRCIVDSVRLKRLPFCYNPLIQETFCQISKKKEITYRNIFDLLGNLIHLHE